MEKGTDTTGDVRVGAKSMVQDENSENGDSVMDVTYMCVVRDIHTHIQIDLTLYARQSKPFVLRREVT